MIRESLTIFDLEFPFDEKFHFFICDKHVSYYEYSSNTGLSKMFLRHLGCSLHKEGFNILYISKYYSTWDFYAQFFPLSSLQKSQFFLSEKVNIIRKNLVDYKLKNIDCVIIEDLQECSVGTQLSRLMIEFDIKIEPERSEKSLKNKILERLKFINPKFVIIGNSKINTDLTLDDFNFSFRIRELNKKEYSTIKTNLVQNIDTLTPIRIEDIKNPYSDCINHEILYFSHRKQKFVNYKI